MRKACLALLGLALGLGEAFRGPSIVEKGQITSPYCAFLSLRSFDDGKTYDLFTSHFGRAGPTALLPGSVDVIEDIGTKYGNPSTITPEKFTGNGEVVWPNNVEVVPASVMNDGGRYVAVFDGFFRLNGTIRFYEVNNMTSFVVTNPDPGFYYHMGIFRDVDGDGHQDLITAKSNYIPGPPAPSTSKLVWLKNPGNQTFPWAENLLFNGPDIHFRLHDFDGDQKEEVVAAQFSSRKVSLYYNTGDFTNSSHWVERVVDSTLGGAFDVHVDDLNGDGRPDLLATNHELFVNASGVFGYEVPTDLVSGSFKRHTLANNFPTTQPGPGQFSPGGAQTFHPNSKIPGKPWIVVSGDGNQRAHILQPISERPGDWRYFQNIFGFYNATVGAIGVADVDGDGPAEIFVPSYDKGKIHVYTFDHGPMFTGN